MLDEYKMDVYRPSIIHAIERAFENKASRGWNKLFYFLDIHETMLYPDYNNTDPRKFYPHAKEVLQFLSTRTDIDLGLYTCSYPTEITKYIEFFLENGINFKHVNRNLDVGDTAYGYYREKLYYNVLFEDKAGFNPEKDWLPIKQYFQL